MSGNTGKDCFSINLSKNSFDFYCIFNKVVLIKMIATLMSAKLATPGIAEIKIFWNAGYGVIKNVDDITKKLSRDAKYIADLLMWLRFGNSSVSKREVFVTSEKQIFCVWWS